MTTPSGSIFHSTDRGSPARSALVSPSSPSALVIHNDEELPEEILECLGEDPSKLPCFKPKEPDSSTESRTEVNRALLSENVQKVVQTNPSTGRFPYVDGRDCLRKAYQQRGLPEEAIDTMIRSISHTTLRQYQTTYKLWWDYCTQTNTDYFNATPHQVIQFLQQLLVTKSHNYGTFNSHRSALSLLLSGNIGNDSDLKRYLKGIMRLRPTKPKYSTTWDPAPVVKYLQALFPYDRLSLETLTSKVVTLLALISAHRVQTLSLIQLSNIQISESGITIKITEPTKTSLRTGIYPVMKYKYFTAQPESCIVLAIQAYINRTEELRNSEDFLFITTKKPFKKASTNTISRWIKNTLHEAGVDTSVFSGHSTRHAATSAAVRKGISVEIIRQNVGWTATSRVFETFYNRPLSTGDNICNAILS
ncbi:uncharacterized protein LOC135267109 [Tribolium castaneum]|uniref:uncharacterized protein LOC135267109 n=1 Tax=Tribolium castaneum TaxID=7070 RepID=UPI0030FF33BC